MEDNSFFLHVHTSLRIYGRTLVTAGLEMGVTSAAALERGQESAARGAQCLFRRHHSAFLS